MKHSGGYVRQARQEDCLALIASPLGGEEGFVAT
jgi:hypothetical protein